jgi:hypothetical protein
MTCGIGDRQSLCIGALASLHFLEDKKLFCCCICAAAVPTLTSGEGNRTDLAMALQNRSALDRSEIAKAASDPAPVFVPPARRDGKTCRACSSWIPREVKLCRCCPVDCDAASPSLRAAVSRS